MNENELLNFDLVHDEYGNYYEVIVVKANDEKLQSITLVNALYKIAANRFFDSEDLQVKYNRKFVSDFLVDALKSRIKHQKREIKSIRELVEVGVEVNIADYIKSK